MISQKGYAATFKGSGANSPQDILKRYWGYTQFRGPQLDVINSFLQGRDNLLVMATGAGKSICMQIPAICTGRTAIIISPLVRDLMRMVEFNCFHFALTVQ